MALVMIVTRDVADRFHGFLASVMLEVAPNVFVAPRMNKGVRERTWKVVVDWHGQEPRGSLVMVWRDLNEVGGLGLAHLGTPPRELIEMDGMWLTRRSRSANVL
jgi:CRISPR-associated protein Cas2